MTLCALQDVKTYLGITSASEDAMLTALVSAASTQIENYCNRIFAQASYTETRNGNDAGAIFVRQFPIVSVQSVVVSGLVVPAATDTTSFGYTFDEERIYIRRDRWDAPARVSGYPVRFERGVQNVVLQYTAGYATIPADLVQACVELVGWKRAKRERLDKTSETLGNQQTQAFKLDGMPPSVINALENYRMSLLPS